MHRKDHAAILMKKRKKISRFIPLLCHIFYLYKYVAYIIDYDAYSLQNYTKYTLKYMVNI